MKKAPAICVVGAKWSITKKPRSSWTSVSYCAAEMNENRYYQVAARLSFMWNGSLSPPCLPPPKGVFYWKKNGGKSKIPLWDRLLMNFSLFRKQQYIVIYMLFHSVFSVLCALFNIWATWIIRGFPICPYYTVRAYLHNKPVIKRGAAKRRAITKTFPCNLPIRAKTWEKDTYFEVGHTVKPWK